MKRKSKKRTLTLLEIMIVITLIALITSVIGYNMKGSLEKGKAFRTKQAQNQLEDMFQLAISEGMSIDSILKDPKDVLRKLNIAKDADKLLKDGWGHDFILTKTRDKSAIIAKSNPLIKYERAHNLGSAQQISAFDDSEEE